MFFLSSFEAYLYVYCMCVLVPKCSTQNYYKTQQQSFAFSFRDHFLFRGHDSILYDFKVIFSTFPFAFIGAEKEEQNWERFLFIFIWFCLFVFIFFLILMGSILLYIYVSWLYKLYHELRSHDFVHSCFTLTSYFLYPVWSSALSLCVSSKQDWSAFFHPPSTAPLHCRKTSREIM